MIAKLTGKLAHKSVEYLIMDVNGVGYQIFVPLSTYYNLPDEGEVISLDIFLYAREDSIILYGFSSILEKEVFLKLISISGIGPRLALNILSGIDPNDLITAIELQDIHTLTSVPGIGKKTAQRMALELKDKLKHLKGIGEGAGQVATCAKTDVYDDVLSALINLGYKRSVADNAIIIALRECKQEKSIENLIKTALNVLMQT